MHTKNYTEITEEKNTGLYGYTNYSKLLQVCIFTSVLMDVSLSLKKENSNNFTI